MSDSDRDVSDDEEDEDDDDEDEDDDDEDEDVERDKALWNAALRGQPGKLKKLIAGGADPNGHKDSVRVIAEASRAPPVRPRRHRVSAVRVSGRIVKFASARAVWSGASSSRRRPNRPPPSSSSESAVAVIRVVTTGHTRSADRATTPTPTPGSWVVVG